MNVFIDSNVFYNQWFLESSQWRLLFHFLNNECNALFLSRLVIDEVENKYKSLSRESYTNLERGMASFESFFPGSQVAIPSFSAMPAYDLKQVLKNKVENMWIVEYEDIPQSEVVSRALVPKRPFQANEKGYRDTLIWLSFLRCLKEWHITGDIAIITNNVGDFMGADKASFHPDLLEDIQMAGLHCNIHIFSSLMAFLNGNVDKQAHLIDEFKTAVIVTPYLEFEGATYLERLSLREISELEMHLFEGERVLANSSVISASIMDGIDELDFDATSDTGENDIFIAVTYNLQSVLLVVDIAQRDYEVYRDVIERSEGVFEVSVGGGVVTLKAFVQPIFQVSIIFNTISEKSSGYLVDGLKFHESVPSQFVAVKRKTKIQS